MKPLAPYFGNRFASVTKKKAIKSAAKTKATSEMETLESRILLSGVGTGLNKKNVTFFDADGDKVTVSLQGKGSFNIDLGGNTNNSDIANISINGVLNKTTLAVEAGSLGVVVTPAGSFTKPVQTKVIYNPNGVEGPITTVGDVGNGGVSQKIATQFYDLTPGFTNIGSITTATNVTSVGSIGLNAAIVPVIDLGSAAAGNINLSTGMVAKVDQLMATNISFQPDRPAWVPNIAKIDLFDISAGSIAGINISSVSTDNDFNGDIVATTGGIGRITGTNADFNGTISLLGAKSALGNIVVNAFSDAAVISAAGDLTFNAAGYGGLISVGGHLNLGLVGTGNFDGTIIAASGVSGLGASLTDTILANQVSIQGQIITQGDIASITLNNANISGGTLDAKNIGTIQFGANASLISGTILASEDLAGIVTRNAGLDLSLATIVVGDTIGLIDVAGGNLEGSITAANFTKITVRGGAMDADILGTSSIGDVTVTDGSITGSLIAQGAAGIGNIKAVSFDNGAGVLNGGAIIGATIYSAGGIASITATTTDTNSPAIGETDLGVDTNIHALGTVGAITATSFGAGGSAIQGLTFVAPSISGVTANAPFGVAMAGTNTFISTTGSIGNISATGLNGGLNGSTTLNSATTVGSISGTALASNGAGISGLVINAQTGISTVTGKAFEGDGIGAGSEFYSLTGNISAISGSSTSMSGTGNGINGLTVNAIAGSVGDITGSSSGIAGGNGLSSVTVDALTGIGTIKGTAIGGNGINDGDFTVTGPNGNITAVNATTVSGIGIAGGATFSAVGGEITTITASPSGAGGQAVNTASFTAGKFGNLEFNVTNLAGGDAVTSLNVTAISGDIGNFTVTNSSLSNGTHGVSGSTITSNKGSIGNITVTTAGGAASHGINNSDFSAAANIGDIDVRTTGNGSDAIAGGSTFVADSDNSGAGNIESVYVRVDGVGSNGISGVAAGSTTFTAENITGTGFGGKSIEVLVTNLNGGDGIIGNSKTLALVTNIAGDLGALTITNSSTAGASNGIELAKIQVAGNMGAVTITAAGGAAMMNASIDPIDIGVITLSGDTTAMDNSEIIATGEIAGLTITGDINGTSSITAESYATTNTLLITGDLAGTITSATSIGAITVTGDMSGTIETDNAGALTGGSIGAVTIGGELSGDITATADTPTSATIGIITIAEGIDTGVNTAISAQGAVASITVSANGIQAGAAGTAISVGSITGALSVTGDIADVVVTTVSGIGSIVVSADAVSGETGDITASITANEGNIGAITVAGDLSATIEATEGNVAASSFGTVNGAAEIIAGSVGVAGTIGNISITANNDDGSNQEIALNAHKATTGGTIGTITATSLEDTTSLEVTVGANAVSLDDIEVAAAGADTASLVLTTGVLLATLGDIDSDGNANLAAVNTAVTTLGTVNVVGAFTMAAANLDNLTSVGDFTVGSVSAGAAAQFGAGAASSIGYITIGSDQNAGAAAEITFTFNSWDGISAASATDVVTVDTDDYSYNDIVAGNPLDDGELDFQDV